MCFDKFSQEAKHEGWETLTSTIQAFMENAHGQQQPCPNTQKRYDPYLLKSSVLHKNKPGDDQFCRVSMIFSCCLSSILILLLTYLWKVIIRSWFAFFFSSFLELIKCRESWTISMSAVTYEFCYFFAHRTICRPGREAWFRIAGMQESHWKISYGLLAEVQSASCCLIYCLKLKCKIW